MFSVRAACCSVRCALGEGLYTGLRAYAFNSFFRRLCSSCASGLSRNGPTRTSAEARTTNGERSQPRTIPTSPRRSRQRDVRNDAFADACGWKHWVHCTTQGVSFSGILLLHAMCQFQLIFDLEQRASARSFCQEQVMNHGSAFFEHVADFSCRGLAANAEREREREEYVEMFHRQTAYGNANPKAKWATFVSSGPFLRNKKFSDWPSPFSLHISVTEHAKCP